MNDAAPEGAHPDVADAPLDRPAAAGDSDGVAGACSEADGGPLANTPIDDELYCTDSRPCGAGLLCGGFSCDTRWTCFAHQDNYPEGTYAHPCPTETAPYCGCDGVTFYPLDTCPDRPYEHVGACDDGVNCNPGVLRCNQTEPTCPEGMVPSVVRGAYGPCVAISDCRCEFVFDCPHRETYRCDGVARRCVPNASVDAGSMPPPDASDASDGPRRSGVPETKRLDELTAEEKKVLCDFKASFYGGYGKSIQCGEGLALPGDDSQDACLAMWPTTCPVTVSQFEQCHNERDCNNSQPLSCDVLLPCM
jgi:hypothetical protein